MFDVKSIIMPKGIEFLISKGKLIEFFYLKIMLLKDIGKLEPIPNHIWYYEKYEVSDEDTSEYTPKLFNSDNEIKSVRNGYTKGGKLLENVNVTIRRPSWYSGGKYVLGADKVVWRNSYITAAGSVVYDVETGIVLSVNDFSNNIFSHGSNITIDWCGGQILSLSI